MGVWLSMRKAREAERRRQQETNGTEDARQQEEEPERILGMSEERDTQATDRTLEI